MNIEFALDEEHISFPASHIKGPGTRIKYTSSQAKIVIHQQHVQDLLGQFKEITHSKQHDTNEALGFVVRRPLPLSKSGHPLRDFLTAHPTSELVGPGKLMTVSDETNTLISKSKQILSEYHINFKILVDNKRLKEVCNVLRFLIPEICSFRVCFFKKLRMNELTIYDEENYNTSPFDPSFHSYLPLDLMETQEKIHHRLYKAILEHILMLTPVLSQEWNESKILDNVPKTKKVFTPSDSLENTFVALMRSKHYVLLKEKIALLKDLLIKYYPEDMSEDWFIKKKNDKLKDVKVQFSIDISD